MSDEESIFLTLPPPKKEDVLFRGEKENWQTNACISRWFPEEDYAQGYRRAAFLLAKHVCQTLSWQDTLIYPIVYLYRHHTELILKRITVVAAKLLDKELTNEELNALSKHKLDILWTNLKPRLKPICELTEDGPFPEEDIEAIDSYIEQLHKHDPDGQRFRYATIKNKKKNNTEPSISLEVQHINVQVFSEAMEKLSEYLEGIADWFDYLLDAKREYQRIIAKESTS